MKKLRFVASLMLLNLIPALAPAASENERAGIMPALYDGEQFTTLDNERRTLTNDVLVIADERGPVALAGVIGGLESEVTDRTVNVLLESANFLGTNIRRTSAALKSRSEASMRFEKGLPPELAAVASKRATKLLVELCGGIAAQGVIDVFPGKSKEARVEVKRERIR